ncbi:DNA-binding transcriptional regulator, FadR family [Devosia psychrophila]|uniref:DNA-binding transcriptional regulator, FadR family n=2 Tax=Devosia psychrophila TaxID=728005 RepID=A0A1I1IPB2_9HYPH|nr:DNA-binding transcriptional regulator, FadR family [Devosia psychrophila]
MLNAASRTLQMPVMPGDALPKGAAKQAVDILGRRIANDAYLPGQIMPTESELADSLGVSRATIRDAIKVLSGKGMVRTARRYGTRVRPIDEWNLLDADVVTWHEHGHPRLATMFAETTELRIILEPAAAELAAQRATAAQVETILEAALALHPEQNDVQAIFVADCRFHATILDATCNGMMRQMRPLIITMLRVSYEFGVLQRVTEPVSKDGHIRVAQAIRAGNGPLARQEMARMLELNRRDAIIVSPPIRNNQPQQA